VTVEFLQNVDFSLMTQLVVSNNEALVHIESKFVILLISYTCHWWL